MDAVRELNEMPTATKSGALWDLNVNIKSSAPLSRLVSLNHPIGVSLAAGNTIANVRLSETVDKTLVPCKDFVLLFRDKAVEDQLPTALAVDGPSGHQALSFSVLPDFRPKAVKLSTALPSEKFADLAATGIDFDTSKTYASAEAEESKETMFVEPKPNEYIFLIDRSGSMHNTINLAR